MKQEINFKISKLLRLKGFDEPCKLHWEYSIEDKSASVNPNLFVGGFCDRHGCNRDYSNSELIEHYTGDNEELFGEFSAPTIFRTVQWLYEKHNIWICVSNVPFENHFTFEYSINNKEKCLHQYGTFESPEKAYESAIEYCLEQII